MLISFTVTQWIAAPPAEVYRVYTDLDNATAWVPNLVRMERLDEGKIAVGAKWRETRRFWGQEASEVFEVISLEPETFLELKVDGSEGTNGRGRYRYRHCFLSEREGTVFTLEGEVAGLSPLMSVAARLFSGSFKKAAATELMALKSYIERGAS